MMNYLPFDNIDKVRYYIKITEDYNLSIRQLKKRITLIKNIEIMGYKIKKNFSSKISAFVIQ